MLAALLVLLVAAAGTARAADEDAACRACHGDAAKIAEALGDPSRDPARYVVDAAAFASSVHVSRKCTGCHFEFEEFPHPKDDIETAGCVECHEKSVASYEASVHGKVSAEGKKGATCADCHGVHDIRRNSDRNARLNALNVYKVCGRCHFSVDPQTATVDELLRDPYTDDAHAHGILRAGLMGSATCVQCHGGHEIRAKGDPDSRVSRQHVAETCGTCHVGVLEQYRTSVHHLVSDGVEHRGATCSDCHRPHEITFADDDFRQHTVESCSRCHDERGGSFRLSYHGKRHDLGDGRGVATCSACHGSHTILPTADPASMVNPANRVATCGRCHPDAHEEFTEYLVHADPQDRARFPQLWWVYMFMTVLVAGTLVLGCIHAVLWLVRALAAGEWRRPPRPRDERFVRRWPRFYVGLHAALMTSVLMLASTGLPLHFADQAWAADLMDFFGGAAAAGWVHRVFAVLLVALVVIYLVHFSWRLFVRREKGLLSGESTMLPRWKDVADLFGNLRWFLFLGPRPRYGRWTYWEKFDFWAVFWGTFVIGLSGLMLWFPEQATRFVPGWALNAAVIIHGFEALLDIAFIFTVHVFHANLRPDKFPMDTMFLTGALPEGEFRHERPIEYDAARADGSYESLVVPEPARRTRIWAYVIGTAALAVGFFFVIAMIVAVATNGAR